MYFMQVVLDERNEDFAENATTKIENLTAGKAKRVSHQLPPSSPRHTHLVGIHVDAAKMFWPCFISLNAVSSTFEPTGQTRTIMVRF